jgi:hypothetical protein
MLGDRDQMLRVPFYHDIFNPMQNFELVIFMPEGFRALTKKFNKANKITYSLFSI